MQPFPQGHGRSLRVASVLLALFVLLAVVAFASRSGFGHASNTGPTPGYVNWATSLVLVLFLAMTPVAIWAYMRQTRERLERQPHRSFQMRVIRGLLFVLVLAVAWIVRIHFHNRFHLGNGLHNLLLATMAPRAPASTARAPLATRRPSSGRSSGVHSSSSPRASPRGSGGGRRTPPCR